MCGGGGDTRVREPESQEALAEQAAFSLRRYGELIVPLENEFMETTQEMFRDQNYENVMGQASTRIAGLYEQGIGDFEQMAMNKGIDPSSGRFIAESEALRSAQARGMGTGAADMGMTNTDQGLGALTGIVRQGHGLENDSMQGYMGLAQNQMRRAQSQANLDFQNNNSLASVAGTAVGATAAYTLPGMGVYG